MKFIGPPTPFYGRNDWSKLAVILDALMIVSETCQRRSIDQPVGLRDSIQLNEDAA